MALNPTQEDYEIAALRVRSSKVKIELLNSSFQIINSIEGIVSDGSISVDATSDIRRTCSLTMQITATRIGLTEGVETWINKYFRVYEGVLNPRTNEFVWWNMGIFLINNPAGVYNATTNQLTFEGLDLMAKLTDRRNGQLLAVSTLIPAGSLLSDVVKHILIDLAGFTKYIIEDDGSTIPYDITMSVGSTTYELLTTIRDLYSDWEMFFDVEGVFHWQKIPKGYTSPILLDFDSLTVPIILTDNVNFNFDSVKNNIIVYGRLLDNGHQVYATASNTSSNNPFSIDNIGTLTYIVNDERIYSDDLAEQRAQYELWLHSNLNDNITLEIVPLYWLNDVNIKIRYNNEKHNIEGDFLIQTLSIPLGIGGNMSLTAYKIYYQDESFLTAISELPVSGEWYTSEQNQFPYYTEGGV